MTCLTFAVVVAGGCGTRVERQAAAPVAVGVATPGGADSSTDLNEAPGAAPLGTTGTVTTVTPGVSGSPRKAPAAGAAPIAGSTGRATSRPGSLAPASGAVGTPTPPRPKPPGGSSAGSAVLPGPDGPRSGVKLATVGTYSGPIGASTLAIVTGLQVWVRDVNAKGGLNGHRVTVAVVDDGGDPARHRAGIQHQVEAEKVLAFIANAAPLTGQVSVDYLDSKQIPVIGSETGSDWFYKSPMFFPQATSGNPALLAVAYSFSGMVKADGKSKVAILACTEAQICETASTLWADTDQAEGLKVVYRTRYSLTQPDFTAECLAARNAGAEAFHVVSDTNSLQRMAASCARQGYRPLFSGFAAQIGDHLKDDPNLDGRLLGTSNVAPWFQENTPATKELADLLQKYAPGKPKGPGATAGWVAGKLLEKAAAQLPEPPTTAAILDGLWSIKNDTLRGLTMPISFTKGQLAPRTVCWWDVTIKGRKWESPDGFRQRCR